ncbi:MULTISPECIES: hypothetical protein [Desulfosediminicola]|uniref:hypothetical protein n=1 Tax=Desulfosediminicola TaxID=2886823 RepID=UPI0010AC884A|nr:hypothetical protein [Desulfosediminicola ganghwensis]
MTRRLRKHFLSATLLALVMVCGCATTEGYKDVVNAWVGQPELELTQTWGPPQRTYETEESKFLVYYFQRDIYFPGSPTTYQNYFDESGTAFRQSYGGVPDRTQTYSCETLFEVIDGIIVSWSFRGNDCIAEEQE